MVTLQRAALQKEYRNAEWCCLSTDDKATINAKNGDILYEIDTGTEYRYNDTAGSWVAQPGESGGGTEPTGVTSFNGRTGAVTPADGDYTAAQVGARPDTWTPNATEVGALPITGGTMTGALVLAGEPTQDNEAATKNYVDTAIAAIPSASTSAKGLVNQAAAVADSSGATDAALETKVNELIGALRTAGIIAPNT